MLRPIVGNALGDVFDHCEVALDSIPRARRTVHTSPFPRSVPPAPVRLVSKAFRASSVASRMPWAVRIISLLPTALSSPAILPRR